MTELKTLKDIYERDFEQSKEDGRGISHISLAIHQRIDLQLRQEVIKWIKAIKTGELTHLINGGRLTPSKRYAICNILKYIFNITDIDLVDEISLPPVKEWVTGIRKLNVKEDLKV